MRSSARILRSVRTRLALWHTAVLALVLVAFTVFTSTFLQRLTEDRVDQSLAEAVRSFQQAVLTEARGRRTPDEAAQNAAREFRFSGRRVLVYGAHHTLVAVSDSSSDDLTEAISAIDRADDSPMHPLFAALTPGRSAYATIPNGRDRIRSYATSVRVGDDAFTIVALQVGQVERSVLGNFRQAVLIAIPLALVLAGVGGYFLARRSFAPVVDMSRRAASIDSESLDARLPVRNTGDELDELASVFNDMLTRIEQSFERQRQFMADASHELRTPVASLRAEASVTLSQPRTAAEYEEALVRVTDDARRLSAIVDDLFTLARLSAEETMLHREDFFLEEVVMDSVSHIRPLATDHGIAIAFHPGAEARCAGDPALIDRIVTNLLDNAIKYSARGSSVLVELATWNGLHRVRVLDHGSGIPIEAQPHVFDRFFRADPSRTRSSGTGGAGLGLSIAWRIARAHGGNLELVSSDATGTIFQLTLPAAG